MKLGFEVVEYEKGPGGILYTVKFQGRRMCELDAFLSDATFRAEPGYRALAARLVALLNGVGIDEHQFKTKNYAPETGCLTYDRNTRLRLYFWFREGIAIAGSGAIKRTSDLADTPETDRAYRDMRYVAERVRRRLDIERSLRITPDGFAGQQGQLTFEKVR